MSTDLPESDQSRERSDPGALPRSTTAFLRDLDRAVVAALLEHDRTLLVLRTVGALAIAHLDHDPGTVVGAGLTPPTKCLFYRQNRRASEDHHAAIDELRLFAAWYCDAAEAVLRSVVSGDVVPSPSALAALTTDSGSETRLDRPLPDLTTLLSGYALVDDKLRSAYESLKAGLPSGNPPVPVSQMIWARAVSAAASTTAALVEAGPGEVIWLAD